MSLEEFKSQNTVSSLVLYFLPQFDFLPVLKSLLDIFIGLTTQTPDSSHMAFFHSPSPATWMSDTSYQAWGY